MKICRRAASQGLAWVSGKDAEFHLAEDTNTFRRYSLKFIEYSRPLLTKLTSRHFLKKHLFRVVMSVGLSEFWRGGAHGRHREEELLIEGNEPAKGRGWPKGWKPRPPR